MAKKRHPIKCDCGYVKGYVIASGLSNHVVCYCKDCQAFADFLGNHHNTINQHGGTEIVQLAPSKVTITQGHDQLAAIRLTNKGLIRWYAKCCQTPIGNTTANPNMPFVGLIHNCLDSKPINQSFGKVKSHWSTKHSLTGLPKKDIGKLGAIRRFLMIVLWNKIIGNTKKTPFFNSIGNPVVLPRVLKR